MISATLAFLMTHIGHPGSPLALVLLTFAGVLLDFAVQQLRAGISRDLCFGLGVPQPRQRRLHGDILRRRLSAIGSWAYTIGGWLLAS